MTAELPAESMHKGTAVSAPETAWCTFASAVYTECSAEVMRTRNHVRPQRPSQGQSRAEAKIDTLDCQKEKENTTYASI